MRQAIHVCGAHRIGHGCRLREDGDLLHYVNDHRIALECCPSSNVQTGAAASIGALLENRGLEVQLLAQRPIALRLAVADQALALAQRSGDRPLADQIATRPNAIPGTVSRAT